MNKKDLKIMLLYNGYKIKPRYDIISFSLDPISYGNYHKLKIKYNKDLKHMLNEWILNIDLENSFIETTYAEVDAQLHQFKHKHYKFTSLSSTIEVTEKIKEITIKYGISKSALVRFFINQQE